MLSRARNMEKQIEESGASRAGTSGSVPPGSFPLPASSNASIGAKLTYVKHNDMWDNKV